MPYNNRSPTKICRCVLTTASSPTRYSCPLLYVKEVHKETGRPAGGPGSTWWKVTMTITLQESFVVIIFICCTSGTTNMIHPSASANICVWCMCLLFLFFLPYPSFSSSLPSWLSAGGFPPSQAWCCLRFLPVFWGQALVFLWSTSRQFWLLSSWIDTEKPQDTLTHTHVRAHSCIHSPLVWCMKGVKVGTFLDKNVEAFCSLLCYFWCPRAEKLLCCCVFMKWEEEGDLCINKELCWQWLLHVPTCSWL